MADHAATVREWITRHPRAFQLIEDPKSPTAPATIVEVHTAKTLSLPLPSIVGSEVARDRVQGGSYLRLAIDDGRTFALSGLGFVFAPSFASTGTVPDAPPTACFRDFEKLLGHLTHLIDDHHDGSEREAMATMMVLLTFLDGGRMIGLDVGAEEKRLEVQLKRLEDRGVM